MATKSGTGVKLFSFKPSALATGGGFPDGVYEVTGADTCHFNYGKDVDLDDEKLSTFVHWSLAPCDAKGKQVKGAEEREQYWSVGRAMYVLPNKAGTGLKPGPEAKKEGIQDNSNFGFFLKQLEALNIDDDFITDDVTCFVGMVARFVSVPQPERNNMKALEDDDTDTKKGPKTVPVIAEILTYPDGTEGAAAEEEEEKPAKAAKPAVKKAAGKAKPAEEEEPEAEETEEETEETEESEEGESADDLFASTIASELKKVKAIDRGKLKVAVFNALNGNDQRKAVTEMFKDSAAVAAVVKKNGFTVAGDAYTKKAK